MAEDYRVAGAYNGAVPQRREMDQNMHEEGGKSSSSDSDSP